MPNIDEMSGADSVYSGSLPWRVYATERKVEELDSSIGRHEGRIIAVEKDTEAQADATARIEKKLDSANAWLRGLVGSVVVALILLVVDLVFGIRKHGP